MPATPTPILCSSHQRPTLLSSSSDLSSTATAKIPFPTPSDSPQNNQSASDVSSTTINNQQLLVSLGDNNKVITNCDSTTTNIEDENLVLCEHLMTDDCNNTIDNNISDSDIVITATTNTKTPQKPNTTKCEGEKEKEEELVVDKSNEKFEYDNNINSDDGKGKDKLIEYQKQQSKMSSIQESNSKIKCNNDSNNRINGVNETNHSDKDSNNEEKEFQRASKVSSTFRFFIRSTRPN